MANARIARFMTEVAPPQFVSVMRRRTSKVLDTINEEERDVCAKNISDISHKACSLSKTMPSAGFSSASASASVPVSAPTSVSSKYFLEEVHRSFSIFNH